jgi:hypothetical protein
VDAPAVHGFQSIWRKRIRNSIRVKSLSLVPNCQPHTFPAFAAATHLDEFVGFHSVAVNDCVAQSLPQRHFNGLFMANNAARLFEKLHELLDEWGDGVDFTSHPGFDGYREGTHARPGTFCLRGCAIFAVCEGFMS